MIKGMFRNRRVRGVGLLVVLLALLAASCTSGDAVDPAVETGQPTCTGKGWDGASVPFSNGTHPLGGTDTVTISTGGWYSPNQFSWTATTGIDAVIVYGAEAFGGPASNVYYYDPENMDDSGLSAPAFLTVPTVGGIEFCYDVGGPAPNSITIIKDAVGPDAATTQFDLVFTASGPTTTPFTLGDGGQRVFSNLASGMYEVHEPGEAGWGLTDVACVGSGVETYLIHPPNSPLLGVNITLAAGGYAVCTFTNTQQQGEQGLTIVKEATPADDTPFEFACTPTAVLGVQLGEATAVDTPALCDFVLSDPSDDTEPLELGSYQITELVPDGWQLDDIQCDFSTELWRRNGNTLSIGPEPCPVGEECAIAVVRPPLTCTFYNSAYGHIVVRKVVAADAPAATFTFDPSWGDNFTLGGNEQTVAVAVPAGAHSVAEIGLPEGWSLASAFCSDGSDPAAIGVSPGETVVCTFNNRFEAEGGSLTVIKRTTPAGGAGFAFDGTLGAFSLDDGGLKMFEDLAAGAYTITESPAEGWEFEDVSCFGAAGEVVDFVQDGASVTVNLAEGQDVTCKFANKEEGTSGPEGSLTIIKHTVPAGGTVFAFDAGALGAFSLDDGGSKVFTDLVAGAYAVTETPAEGWEFASITCDALDYVVDGASVTVNLAEGEAAVCTFHNGELPYTGSPLWLPLLLAGLAAVLLGLGTWVTGLMKQARA